MENFIGIETIIEQVSATSDGNAVYSNRSGLFCGIVDSENIYTDLADVIEMTIEYIENSEKYAAELRGITPKLTPSFNNLGRITDYNSLGKITGFSIQFNE